MDAGLTAVIEKKMARAVDALRKNRFDAHIISSRAALTAKLDALMPKGCSCSVGGSMTLFETGVIDYLKKGDFDYLDRYELQADTKKIFHEALSCDVYLTSTNAVTEDGCLYNMDGCGNRVAALVYGPEKVIVITGYNKIVKNVQEARERNRQIAAPANTTRLNKKTPCVKTGTCMDCTSSERICSYELICHYQMIPERITVLLVNEALGY